MAEAAAATKPPETDNAGAIAPKAGGAPPPKKPAAADAGRAWPDKTTAADAHAKALPENRIQLLDFVDPGFHVTLEQGTGYEEVFRPSFWANVIKSKRIAPGHRIRVTNDQMSFFAWLVVSSCGNNWAQVRQETYVASDDMHGGAAPEKGIAQHRVEFAGPIKKYRIIRTTDASEIRAGFDTESEANRYLDDYLRRVGK